MKRSVLLNFILLFTVVSCVVDNAQEDQQGYLELSVKSDVLIEESTTDVDDLSKYEVYITSDTDNLLNGYPAEYSSLPSAISIPVGNYTVRVQSILDEEKALPTRDSETAWYYKGEETIEVQAGATTSADVTVSPAVTKVTIELTDGFLASYPDYSFDIQGITFDSSNMADAYFDAGDYLTIDLSYTEDGSTVTRRYTTPDPLEGGLATFTFDYEGNGTIENGDASIDVDISHDMIVVDYDWDITDGEIVDGNSNGGENSISNPLSVPEAMSTQDGNSYWVEGYIVGYAKGSSSIITDYTKAEDSNIVIAANKGESDTDNMLFVELTTTGSAARQALGLASTNGESLGYKVKVRGELTTYFSSPGLKGVNLEDEFEIVSE